MINRALLPALLLLFVSIPGSAQTASLPSSPGTDATTSKPLNPVQSLILDHTLGRFAGKNCSRLESPGSLVTTLDVKAPRKAQREYDKGYQLLMRRNLPGAVQHLAAATSIYPSFVAAHNALGSAYLGLGQNDEARGEFARAVSLDDHLPESFLNLGCAELALHNFPAAQESIQKASAIAPLDIELLTLLAYGQLMNHDYAATIATAHQVHDREHEDAAVVHLYAAAAWEAQDNLPQAQEELATLLREDHNSPATEPVRQMLAQLEKKQKRPPAPAPGLTVSDGQPLGDAPASATDQLRGPAQNAPQEGQGDAPIAATKAESRCPLCGTTDAAPLEAEVDGGPTAVPRQSASAMKNSDLTIRVSADEVALVFAATYHGKSVTDLTATDVQIRDDGMPPAAVAGFRNGSQSTLQQLRNESQLPLRLGLVIDTSASITSRFRFEKDAAINFLQTVMTNQRDLAFVIGFANSVLLVQDFTDDQQLIARSVSRLVPGGGTALWDAVTFAADKLARRTEAEPVARILVVITDGRDNLSKVAFKDSVTHAQHGDVIVYTVNTEEADDMFLDSWVGEHALRTLAELTGGAAFAPGSIRRLNRSLADLQQVIRSRYLVSYKPALFKCDGRYRAIEITAAKDGHKLRVYARKGYFAVVPGTSHF